ncbi:hypothetical protein [Catenuloplanes japonicus]|uniref:hypothetical protein n=1 Tax=Catenuloplanes japonicus TaxID=33876 RepID=UPI000527C7B2|nr:hypothetical protein [Catenuloplanes japonicus]
MFDDPDLFFALRGSKGNLGVVTAVEFSLFPITHVYGGGLWFPGERVAELLPVWRDWARTRSTGRLPRRTPYPRGVCLSSSSPSGWVRPRPRPPTARNWPR